MFSDDKVCENVDSEKCSYLKFWFLEVCKKQVGHAFGIDMSVDIA